MLSSVEKTAHSTCILIGSVMLVNCRISGVQKQKPYGKDFALVSLVLGWISQSCYWASQDMFGLRES